MQGLKRGAKMKEIAIPIILYTKIMLGASIVMGLSLVCTDWNTLITGAS